MFISSWILEQISVELLVTTHITGMGWWIQVSAFLHFGSDFLFFFFFFPFLVLVCLTSRYSKPDISPNTSLLLGWLE